MPCTTDATASSAASAAFDASELPATTQSATAPDSQQGRVFAMQAMFSDLVCMVPLGLSGVSVELAGARSTLLLIGALGLCLVLVLKLTSLGHTRHARAERMPA